MADQTLQKDNPNLTSGDEIDFRGLFTILWGDKILIIIITSIFAISSVFLALSIPNQYRATAILAPAQTGSGGISDTLGQLTGLASLAGLGIRNFETTESKVAQEVMKSWSFIEEFIKV